MKQEKYNLEEIRNSESLWNQFIYNDEKNYIARYMLATQLQYDLKKSDEKLVQFLMDNEIKCRRNSPLQGIGESLNLISYLLSRFKNPENSLLFERAKWANFDTWCGYDGKFIFSAGIQATCDYLAKEGITEKQKYIYEHKDALTTMFTQEQIDEFLNQQEKWFPSSIEYESTKTLLDRAIQFDHKEQMNFYFKKLEDESNDINSLTYYAESIKNYDKAIFYQLKKIKINKGLRIINLNKLANLYCINNCNKMAFKTAKKCTKLIKLNKKEIGNYDYIIETWYNICLKSLEQNNICLADKAFFEADKLFASLNHAYLVLRKLAYDCSVKLNKTEHILFYKKLVDEEQKRIDNKMKQNYH